MKLHVLNDLHVEFEDFRPPPTDADVVVLAGDIGVGHGGLDWAADRFPDKPVIYVPGNHEFYYQDVDFVDELKAAAPAHIHVLNDDQIVIDDVRFLGSVLWTDFSLFGEAQKILAMRHAALRMPDFRIVSYQDRLFAPADAMRLHEASRTWLTQILAQPFQGETVVVTHHAPSARSVHPRYANDMLTPAFATRLEILMEQHGAALWIHGHTHDPFDYQVHQTRVVCNPRGYAPDALSPGFRADLVVEV